MNQILQVKDTKQLKPIKAKKVLLFLAIIIVMFALGINIYLNIINGNIKLSIFTKVPENIPEISLTQTDNDELIIEVESNIGISNIKYNWNNEKVQVIECSGNTHVEETIDIPMGENTIYISIIDVNGKETKKEQKLTVELPKPVIELSVVGNDIKITVTSETELSEVTYKWNSEQEKKENMFTYENRTNFEKKLDIPIGQNTLTIVAIDINGRITEKIQEIKGVTKATTTTRVQGEYLHFTVTAKENIEKVEFEFNGQKYLMNTDTFGETKTVHYKVKLTEGTNYLTITSTTQSGGTDTTSWEQKYPTN